MSRKTLVLQTTLCAAAIGGAFIAGRATTPAPQNSPAPASDRAVLALQASSPLGVKTSAVPSATGSAGDSTATRHLASPTPEQASARIKAIFENEDPVALMSDFLAFLKTLDTNEARTAALGSLMENFNPRERARELNMLMSSWADADPLAALTSVKDNKDWTGTMAAGTVLSKWAKTDPSQALAWATENGKAANATDTGNYYLVSVLDTLAKIDLDRAAVLAQTSMNRSRARGDIMERLLDQFIGQRSPAAAQAWATSLPPGPFRDGTITRLASKLASTDAPGAAAWASTLPESESKPAAMAEVVQRWSREQPNEAGAWLNQFPPSPATDAPRETFAMQVQKTDPEAAIAWASTITDVNRRERATRDLVRSWIQREPDQARAWVDANNVSEGIKRRYGTKPNG